MENTKIEKLFPQFKQFIKRFISLFERWSRELAIYSKIEPYEHGEDWGWNPNTNMALLLEKKLEKFQEPLHSLIKSLGEEFKTADLHVPRNSERYCLYQFILWFYRDDYKFCELAGLPEPDYTQLTKKHLERLKKRVAEILGRGDIERLRRPDLKILRGWDLERFEELERLGKLNLKRLARTPLWKLGRRDNFAAIAKMIDRIKTFQDPIAILENIEVIDQLLRSRPELMPLCEGERPWKYEDLFKKYELILAEIAAKIRKNENASSLLYDAFNTFRETTGGNWEGEMDSAKYPNLNNLYQTEPFELLKPWKVGDKLRVVLDVMRWISFPFNERDKVWFEKFRELIRSVYNEGLILEGLFKYLQLAEMCIRNGRVQDSFEIYRGICQEIEKQLLPDSPIDPYRYSVEMEIHWDSIGNIHNGLDNQVMEVLTDTPIEKDSSIFSDLLKFFIQKPTYFDECYPEGILNLYKSAIRNQPELAKKYVLHLGELNRWNIEFIITTPPELITQELSDYFEWEYDIGDEGKIYDWYYELDERDYRRIGKTHSYLLDTIEKIIETLF